MLAWVGRSVLSAITGRAAQLCVLCSVPNKMTIAHFWKFLKREDDEHSHLNHKTCSFKTVEGGNLGKTLVRFENMGFQNDHRCR